MYPITRTLRSVQAIYMYMHVHIEKVYKTIPELRGPTLIINTPGSPTGVLNREVLLYRELAESRRDRKVT